MKFSAIFYLLGRLFCIVGLFAMLPIATSLWYGEKQALNAFLVTASLTLLTGSGLMYSLRASKDDAIAVRDGFLLVTASWLAISLIGAIPFMLIGPLHNFADAFFESTSGFTTTGATVLTDIESLPMALLLWRSMSQWIGGLGIIVLAVAVLPQLSVGGMQLMKNEMPGPTFEQLKPRIKQTALSLWKIYVLFSALVLVLFYLNGMNFFESLCHAFTTSASGGFSTRNDSMAAFSSHIQLIAIVFMFLAGTNFVLHYAWLHGDFKRVITNPEWKFYCILILTCCIAMTLDLVLRIGYPVFDAIRMVTFQVVSISTSSGFTTANYDAWPFFSKGILFLLMFVGGCAGSTSGGFKQLRLQLFLLKARGTLIKQIFPKAVVSIKMGKHPVQESVLDGVSNLFLVSVVLFSFCTLILLSYNIGFITATSAVVASLSNIGPGLGLVGPTLNYAWMPDPVKILLSLCMIIGRLEFFTVLVLFLPIAWKK